MMIMKHKRDIRPALLKFGVALTISLGGIIYSIIRTKRIRPPKSPPPTDYNNLVGTEGGSSFPYEGNLQENSFHHTKSPNCDLSQNGRSSGDKDGCLLQNFEELVNNIDPISTQINNPSRKDVEPQKSNSNSPTGYTASKRDDREQEIANLKNLVRILKERERVLEIQLLEYYGLKEQETAVMELHNRLNISNMEAKLFTLKIESLQADNRRLEAQVADYTKVVADLEAAKAKLKLLKKKLKLEAEQNKEHMLVLQDRVTKLQDKEQTIVGSSTNNQLKIQKKLQDLEQEVEELRKSNYNLQLENSDLGRRLDYAQIIATSVLEDEETETLKEEKEGLKKQNDDLRKEVDQLQEDRCADVEELVYLRWINACLRYELRNYQPGPGKTAARDLSKTLSPKSEEKAKQLILEYATKEGLGGRGHNTTELDSDHSSSSHASYITDPGDFDDSPVDSSYVGKTNTSSRKKIFSKLIKLVRGNSQHHSRTSSAEVPASVEDVVGQHSPSSNSEVPRKIDGRNNKSRSSSLFRYSADSPCTPSMDSLSRRSTDCLSRPSLESSRLSWDLNKPLYLQGLNTENVDDFEGGRKEKSISISKNSVVSLQENKFNEDVEIDRKSDLLKYAEALIEAQGDENLTDIHDETTSFCRRTTSYSSL